MIIPIEIKIYKINHYQITTEIKKKLLRKKLKNLPLILNRELIQNHKYLQFITKVFR